MPPASKARPTTVQWVRADSLRPHPKNPREGDEEAVARSLVRHGIQSPVIAWKGTIYAGHTRTRAVILCAERGLPIPGQPSPGLVPVVEASFQDEKQAESYLLADNTTGLLGGYDAPRLDALRLELPGFEDFGGGLDLDRFISSVQIDLPAFSPDPPTPPDPIPPLARVAPPKPPRSPPPNLTPIHTPDPEPPPPQPESAPAPRPPVLVELGRLRGSIPAALCDQVAAYCQGRPTSEALAELLTRGLHG